MDNPKSNVRILTDTTKKGGVDRMAPFSRTVLPSIFFVVVAAIAPSRGAEPPAAGPVATALSAADFQVGEWKERDFLAFDSHYKEKREERVARGNNKRSLQ